MIPIREDIKQIRNYLTIVQLRYRDKINIELDIDEEILDFYTPKLYCSRWWRMLWGTGWR